MHTRRYFQDVKQDDNHLDAVHGKCITIRGGGGSERVIERGIVAARVRDGETSPLAGVAAETQSLRRPAIRYRGLADIPGRLIYLGDTIAARRELARSPCRDHKL